MLIVGLPVLLCLGLVVAWPIAPRLIQGISFEIRCAASRARSECLRLKHQEAELQSLKAIENEVLHLRRSQQPAGQR